MERGLGDDRTRPRTGSVTYSFLMAWSPPEGLLAAASRAYPDLRFHHEFVESPHIFVISREYSFDATSRRYLRLAPRPHTITAVEIIPDKRKVVGLVEQAHRGKICLPNFQRDFVWPRDDVADLVRSIVRGYFIGSLLLLRCDPANPPFAPEYLRGSKPDTTEAKPELLVLDGQQRLSSLIYALTAPDLSLKDSTQRRWFFVDLDVLLNEPDSDDVVFDRSLRELRGLDTPEEQFAQRKLPCTVLLNQDAFYSWRDDYEDWLEEVHPEQVETYKQEWRSSWTKAASEFQNFEVPLVELPQVDDTDSEAIGRVCAIFEKLNSTGVDLSVYDLLTARLYRSNIKLHNLWNESVLEHELLRKWSGGKADRHKFGVLVLRTLALLRGLDPKPRILIDLSPEDFVDDWRKAALAMERALKLVTHVGPDGFGVFAEKWLPGFGLLPILAALRAEVENRKLGEKERADLRRWYWCNVFLERYSSAVESKSRKDYVELIKHWLHDGPEPEVFQDASDLIGAPGFRIRDSASSGSARYCGVFCLLALRQARDWRRQEDIQLQDLQDHHIFPKAYLRRKGITNRNDVNSVANRTLISDETNNKIKDKAPASYLNDPDIISDAHRMDLLRPHFMGEEVEAELDGASEDCEDGQLRETYEDFVRFRQIAIIEEIRLACGVEVASDEDSPADEVEGPAADVVDGSAPVSLDDLDEAVQALLEEDADAAVVP
jgi:hypothetical protein